MPVTQAVANAVGMGVPLMWKPHINLLLQNWETTVQEALWDLLSQLPLVGLTDTNKNTGLINKRMGKGIGQGQRTHPRKVEIFKWLLRNSVNKECIDKDETKGKKKQESQGTYPIRVEIFRWLLRNEMNKMEIGIKWG